MHRVVVTTASYSYRTLKPQVFDIMDAFCGDLIGPNTRVVIKPNLLAPAAPDRAMLTHPLIVRAAVEYVLDKRGKVQLSDSPAVGSLTRVLRESGIEQELAGLAVECREFKESSTIAVGQPFQQLEIARDALEADVLINLPKLKTHSQMLLTLGIKNLFGCIVGWRKPEWHLRTGVDRKQFATLLVRIYQALQPTVTILDGITAMEGQGPGRGGIPRDLGVLMGSDDALAVDITVCRMLGLSPDALLTNASAAATRACEEPISVQGELPHVDGFRLPDITPLVFGPPFLHGYLRRYLTQRPAVNESSCRLCGECWQYCPAGAISQAGRTILFDYDKCIRCYCCLEVCPQGALRTEQPWAARVAQKFIRPRESGGGGTERMGCGG